MEEREELIKKLIKEKKGSRKDYLNLLNSIAYYESGHTMDPKIKQIGGGPGRGKYQFETGRNAGAITAARRTKQYYKEQNIPVPEWLNSANSNNDLDASTLTSEQQDILFLANMRKHPKANFTNIWEDKESIPDFWANYHWAGAKKDRKKRIESFKNSQQLYEKNKPTYKEAESKPFNFNINGVDYKPLFESIMKNPFSEGGDLSSNQLFDKSLNEFNGGGTHGQNPLGGIPLGIGSNGK